MQIYEWIQIYGSTSSPQANGYEYDDGTFWRRTRVVPSFETFRSSLFREIYKRCGREYNSRPATATSYLMNLINFIT